MADDNRCSVRLLVFGASLREGSMNDRLASLAASVAQQKGATVERATMLQFECPAYDLDDEISKGLPAGAQALHDVLNSVDGFMIASPEYNASMSARHPSTIRISRSSGSSSWASVRTKRRRASSSTKPRRLCREVRLEKRKIGSLDVSIVGVGCNNFGIRLDEAHTEEVINAAVDDGINLFDTADTYANGRSEELIGRFLASRRSQVMIATKFGLEVPGEGKGAHPEYVRRAFEASVKRLRTDYVDLYQQHVPDPEVPIAETLGALNELVSSGQVREIGCSNFSAQQLREAESTANRLEYARFVSVQNEYSLLHREPEAEVLPECERQGIAFLPFFPLKSGLLTGKYRKGEPIPEGTRVAKYERYRKLLTEENLDKVEVLIDYAQSRGHGILDLAISWLLAHPPVASVIAGATSAEQIRANARAAGWQLTPADLAEIDVALSDAGKAARVSA